MLSIQWTTRDDAAQRGLSSALRLESTQPRLDFKETRTKKKRKKYVVRKNYKITIVIVIKKKEIKQNWRNTDRLVLPI